MGLAYNCPYLVHFHYGGEHGGIQAAMGLARKVAECYILIPREREKEFSWAWYGILKPESPPPVIYFFQQGHTHSIKTTPTSTRPHLLILPLHVRVWGPFSFKPLQTGRWCGDGAGRGWKKLTLKWWTIDLRC